MATTAVHTVPVGSDGLQGWTSCCEAAATYSIAFGEPVLCCKRCWNEVEMVMYAGEVGDAISAAVCAVMDGAIAPDEGVRRQREAVS